MVREDDEKDVSSYCMTLRRIFWDLSEEALDCILGSLSLEQTMNLLQDRLKYERIS
jgi:hypothetical protein